MKGPGAAPQTDLRIPPPPPADAAPEIALSLREAAAAGGGSEPLPRPTAAPLPASEAQALLSRLPALEPAAREDFAVRKDSAPPPRAGVELRTAWPPPPSDGPPEVPAGPIQVVRAAPDGDVPVAAQVSVTFNQPMVPLTGQDDAAAHVPVVLEPRPPGQWRWLGTSTLVFEPDVRMPGATEFTVTLPAGATSAVGGRAAVGWTQRFRTPPVALTQSWPSGESVALDPVLVLGFDQEVDADAVVRHAEVTAGRRQARVRAASAEELGRDPAAQQVYDALAPGRRVAMVLQEPLDRATPVELLLPAGLASAEGPRRTEVGQSFGFRTHDALRVERVECGWDGRCWPGAPIRFTLSNPVDEATLSVSLDPGVDGVQLHAWGNEVRVEGATLPDTRYAITLGEALRDVFGQAVEGERRFTVDVGPAEPARPYIDRLGSETQLTDPFRAPSAAFVLTGMTRARVRVHRVTPADWEAWVADDRWEARRQGRLPGVVVVDEARPVPPAIGPWSVLEVPLAPYLDGPSGQFIVEVSETSGPVERRQQAATWVQVTGIGLVAVADADALRVWATDLKTGRPAPEVEVRHGGDPAWTDAKGIATLPLPAPSGRQGVGPVVAKRGDELAMLPPTQGRWATSQWGPGRRGVEPAWFVYNDRGLYRPGETVHIKGFLRGVDFGPGGDLTTPDHYKGSVGWRAQDAHGVELARGELALDAFGGFALDLKLPDTPNLGPATVVLEHPQGSFGHSFEIQEFRRPEFEVSAVVESAAPHRVGGEVVVATTASYYAGGALPGAEVSWTARASLATWQPPGWSEWRFGRWRPWWCWWTSQEATGFAALAGTTDSMGTHRVALDVARVVPTGPVTVELEATVMDVNRQAWSTATSALVHAGSVYVGARPDRAFYEPGGAVNVELVAVDLDGASVDAMVEARLVRREWRAFQGGEWREVDVEERVCSVRTPRAPASCRFDVPDGSWELRARVSDADGRVNETRFPVWVGSSGRPVADGVQREDLNLIPDKDLYQPGDTARVRVQLPFHPAELLITTERSGVRTIEQRRVDEPSTVVEVGITEAHLPNLWVAVEAVGVAGRTDVAGAAVPGAPPRPAAAAGRLDLRVSTLSRTLSVAVAPEASELAPGESTEVVVRVTDARGAPVAGASVALVVVDEAVLALTGHQVPDPVGAFHPPREAGTELRETRSWIRLSADLPTRTEGLGGAGAVGRGGAMLKAGAMPPPAPSMVMAESGAMDLADGAPMDPGGTPIAVRSDFSANAAWLPALRTGADGVARHPVKLPDNLTRYRVTAVVVDGGRSFGKGEADLTARLPLMLRPSAPRFLNFGDRAELPLVVQNQTAQPMVVSVALRADNLTVDAGGSGGRKVTVPARDRVEVRIPVAAEAAGTARLQAAAASGRYADAAELSLPVWTPATAEAFAVYGVLDGARGTVALRQPLQVPKDIWPQHGGLEIQTSSTALQELTDALLYLVEYPYGCVEQISSRVLAVAALRDVLEAFDAEGLPAREALDRMVREDVEELIRRQEPSGAWGWWRRGEAEPSPTTTLHATHALVRAHQAGVPMDVQALSRALKRIESIEEITPKAWGVEARMALKAQAVAVRRAGKRDTAAMALAVWREGGGVQGLSLESLGWLLPSLPAAEQAEVRRHLANRVTESAASARFVTSYGETDDAMILGSARRTDAVVLDALLQVAPDDPLLPKVVAGLLDGRAHGRWMSTQENAWILLALQRYFRVAEGVTPDMVARAWLGAGLVGEQAWKGRSTARATTSVPMASIPASGADVTLAREGEGRLYWRMGLRYAPRSLQLEPAERGFSVTRRYEAVDDPADVRQDADGTWHIRAGARVRVVLGMVAPDRRYHVALVDPLPAGLEILNPELLGTASAPPADGEAEIPPWARGWWGRWYDHENLRDERAEAHALTVWPGAYTWRYVARATTPGTFVVPPTRAEEMYHPETFGRSGSGRVVVE